jgi:hypothetical protein
MVFRRGKKDSEGSEQLAPDEATESADVEIDEADLEAAAERDDDDQSDDDVEAGDDDVDVPLGLVSPVLEPHQRPWDLTEAPAEGPPRLDLGSLQVPVLPDTEIRVELNDQKMPIAATVLHAGSAVQVLAFAAPRSDGIWDDVRAEIAESVQADGGEIEEFLGDFGVELRARVRAEVQPGQPVEQRLRFVGFDGPRWFVRAVFSGPAAAGNGGDPAGALLDSVLAELVVVRGEDAMAPRDPLPLRLPREATAAQEAAEAEQAEGAAPTLDPFTRGPEITEIQ